MVLSLVCCVIAIIASLVNRKKNQEHNIFHARRLVQNLKMLTTPFDGSDPVTVLLLLFRLVKDDILLYISKTQACPIILSFLKGKALNHSLAARNASSYARLCY